MLGLSTTLLLAATCLLTSPGVSTETVITCNVDTVQRLSCDIGVIRVEEALYGRADAETCSEGRPPNQLANTECSQGEIVDVLKRRCDGKTVCEVSVNVFGTPDPCKGTFKYLQTKYTCLPAIRLVTCEHSLAQLQCDQGQVISVYGGSYGRYDQTTCTYKRPASQIQNVDCSQHTSIVSESCNGKNSCTIKASNSVFGDPCYGTYKYLEVAYTCLFVSTERAITCGSRHNVQRLSCDIGVIGVRAALFGRSDSETCSEGRPESQLTNTECSQVGTVDVLKRRCDGKRECELNIQVVGTTDPCPGIYKYLDTYYTCFPAIYSVTCESSLAHLQCDEGQIIFVYGAHYGRSDQTTCIYQRPAGQISNVDCPNPTGKVADSCNGKNSCTIRASNSVFGDSCPGTYKYLEVAYICEYPGVIPQQLPEY
ncbi:rhamnose-binding lectin-like [Anoplopoma fimbria]|uniref:rhamnose-binding lectin-like n=1 Tax=Anoplopoma fimbria TaxID=229290 RepID=UPI0023ECCAD0|nr:rhamnose-binding lectin-like [Anoplopoma fimbria]